MKEKKINGYDEWEVRDAIRTLQRAYDIKKDAKLMKAISELAKEEMQSMAHIAANCDEKK